MTSDIISRHGLFMFLQQVSATASSEYEIRERLRAAGFPNPEAVSIEIVSRNPSTGQLRFHIIAQTSGDGVVRV